MTELLERLAPRILCIEDDPDTLELITEFLIDAGFEAITAQNGAEGLARIIADRPDLVLCDVSMPRMSGFEVLERLKDAAPWMNDMPFIFLTALADRESELQGRRLGSDDYVAKPIDFDILDTIIRARLERVARGGALRTDMNLNNREIQALTWSARGKTSDEIADILESTKRNVDFFLDSARKKLGVATRIQAVATAIVLKIIKI